MRNNNFYYGETRAGAANVTDSISLMETRLKLLGGLRYVPIRGQSQPRRTVFSARLDL